MTRRTRRSSQYAAVAVALVVGSAPLHAQPVAEEYLDSLERMIDSSDVTVATADSAPAVLRVDSSSVERRTPSKEMLARFREDDEFDYGRSYREPESVWDRIMRAIAEWFRDLLGRDGEETFWDILTYVILGVVIIFVVMKLLDADTRALFFRSRREEAGAQGIEEDVHAIDYPTQIERAVAAGDLRLAIRLHYLRLLRDLSDSGAIAWRQNKTDHDYVRELAGSPLQSGFERAALFFEYVWYGDFPIDLESYRRIAEVIDRAATASSAAR